MSSVATHVLSASDMFSDTLLRVTKKRQNEMMTCFSDSLKSQVNSLDAKYANEVRELRELISNQNAGNPIDDKRLEQLFSQLMSSEKMQKIFNESCQVIGGRRVSNGSILKAIINAPKRVKREYIYSDDPLNDDPIAAKWTLTGDKEVVLQRVEEYSATDNPNEEIYKETWKTDHFPMGDGLFAYAEASQTISIITPPIVNGQCQKPIIKPLVEIDMAFDFLDNLDNCVLDNLSSDLDINGDGIIGYPPAPEQPIEQPLDNANPNDVQPEVEPNSTPSIDTPIEPASDPASEVVAEQLVEQPIEQPVENATQPEALPIDEPVDQPATTEDTVPTLDQDAELTPPEPQITLDGGVNIGADGATSTGEDGPVEYAS